MIACLDFIPTLELMCDSMSLVVVFKEGQSQYPP